jgi:predicted LPLAT superfamily acyltransferase
MKTAEKDKKNSPKITVKKRGNSLGIFIFEIMVRTSGLKGAYFLLEFVSTHYLLFDAEARNGSLAYLKRRFPESNVLVNLWRVHRLFVNQGRQLIDRYVIARHPDFFKFNENMPAEARAALEDPACGAVLIMSHAGNWQVALRQMGHLKKDICIVMRPEDNPSVKNSLRMGDTAEGKAIEIIDPESDFGGVLQMIQALKDGKLVCIMGDRGYGFDTLPVSFLGDVAYFPYGAFYIAAATQCPVIALLTHKISDKEYIADIANIGYPIYEEGKNKKKELGNWVGKYVSLLEAFVDKHPYECFLFQNIWEQKESK